MLNAIAQIRRAATTTVLAAGRQPAAGLLNNPASVIPMGVFGAGRRSRSAILSIGGSQADNTLITYQLWAIYLAAQGSAIKAPDDYELIQLASGTARLGSGTGHAAAGALASASERIADTMTLTVEAWGTAVSGAFGGTITAHSPADNTPAHLIVPDAGSPVGLIVRTDVAAFVIAEGLV